jgi:phosphatidylinositol glycan class V
MVLMSLPVAWLSVGGCWAYFSADWQRALTLGLYSRRDKLPRWLGGAAGMLGRWAAAWRVRKDLPAQRLLQQRRRPAAVAAMATALQGSVEAAPLVYHWALMTAVALLAMHVNVATRFLSACPPLYWHAAQLLAGGGARARLLWLWCFAYIALGCLLFPNFYPWT